MIKKLYQELSDIKKMVIEKNKFIDTLKAKVNTINTEVGAENCTLEKAQFIELFGIGN